MVGCIRPGRSSYGELMHAVISDSNRCLLSCSVQFRDAADEQAVAAWCSERFQDGRWVRVRGSCSAGDYLEQIRSGDWRVKLLPTASLGDRLRTGEPAALALIRDALAAEAGNVTRAATRLGAGVRTLQRWVSTYPAVRGALEASRGQQQPPPDEPPPLATARAGQWVAALYHGGELVCHGTGANPDAAMLALDQQQREAE